VCREASSSARAARRATVLAGADVAGDDAERGFADAQQAQQHARRQQHLRPLAPATATPAGLQPTNPADDAFPGPTPRAEHAPAADRRALQLPRTQGVLDRRAVQPYRHHRCTPMHQDGPSVSATTCGRAVAQSRRPHLDVAHDRRQDPTTNPLEPRTASAHVDAVILSQPGGQHAAPPGRTAARSDPSNHRTRSSTGQGLRWQPRPPQDHLLSTQLRIIKRWPPYAQHRHTEDHELWLEY
jgi:hypothetical protein